MNKSNYLPSANAEYRNELIQWLESSDRRLEEMEKRLTKPQATSEYERLLAAYRVELHHNKTRRDEVGNITERSTEAAKEKCRKGKNYRRMKKNLLTQ